jgi:hypothetical protein
MIRDYLFDIAKIVEGAANGDYEKVVAYSENLEQKFASAGETGAAKRIREILGKSKAGSVTLARAGKSSPLPVDSDSRIPVADEERPVKGDAAVFLSADVQKTVDQFLTFFRAADRLTAHGVGISPSLLMYGPPGCGKTQLARVIAAELGYPLITARSDALISSYLGSTAKNLRLLFEHASARPCVLFLDEFDAIAKMRDDDRELGELKRVVISLMQNIDAMGRDHVLLAATNHEHLLDPAIWRRFAYKVEVKPPETDARRAMLNRFLGKFANAATVELGVALSAGMSGAQLRDLSEDAVRAAIIANQPDLTASSLAERLTGESTLAGQICAAKKADPTCPGKQLAELFDVSPAYVSKVLKQRSENAA